MILSKTIEKSFGNILKEKRSKRVFVNVANSFLVKIFSTAVTLSLIPVSLRYTNAETYGVWLTLSSVITWVQVFDLGLSAGLANRLAVAFAKAETKLAKAYISTTYSFMIVIMIFCSATFFAVCNFIDWNKIFNTTIQRSTLLFVVKCTFSSLCLSFLLKPLNDVLKAKQKHFLLGIISLSGNLLALLLIVLLGKYFDSKFIFLAVVLGGSYPFTLLIFSVFFYSNSLKELRPKISLLKFNHLRNIFGISIKFFIINASVIIMLSSNNFLISFFVNPESVTLYTIAYRLFSIVLIFQYMIVTPLWPAYTDAFTLKDFVWIRAMVGRINKLNLMLCFGVLLLSSFAPYIYSIWIGSSLFIPIEINLLLALYVIIALYKETYVSFINGSGQLNLQTLFSLGTLILQIPLAYFLIRVCKLGLNGVLILNIFWALFGLFLWKYQYSIIMRGLQKRRIWT
jgi:O-antigen/teichoic acid export membrane protein